MIGFSKWHLENPQERAATIFVIADQLRDEEFRMWLQELISNQLIDNNLNWLNNK